MDCSLPSSSVHGIFLARILEWIVISFSRCYRLSITLKIVFFKISVQLFGIFSKARNIKDIWFYLNIKIDVSVKFVLLFNKTELPALNV